MSHLIPYKSVVEWHTYRWTKSSKILPR